MELTDAQTAVRDEFIRVRGVWSDLWESILRLDASFLEAYLKLSRVPWDHGPLEPKVKEFIYITVDAAATHLYEPGIRQHIRKALEYGATKDELMEVLEITSALGIHAVTTGIPALQQVLTERGTEQAGQVELDERQFALRDEFKRNRGYWDDVWQRLLELDPNFFEAYVAFSSAPWVNGVLPPKVKELIYIAFDASATHMYVDGLILHLRNAFEYGATVEEVMEVLEIASVIGIHTCTEAVPILIEELERAGIPVS